jgi:hypothetical protein
VVSAVECNSLGKLLYRQGEVTSSEGFVTSILCKLERGKKKKGYISNSKNKRGADLPTAPLTNKGVTTTYITIKKRARLFTFACSLLIFKCGIGSCGEEP